MCDILTHTLEAVSAFAQIIYALQPVLLNRDTSHVLPAMAALTEEHVTIICQPVCVQPECVGLAPPAAAHIFFCRVMFHRCGDAP
jgi:hypothetical protein